jgi:hypothetical protein
VTGVQSLIDSAFPEAPLPDMTLQEAELIDRTLSREIGDVEWEAVRRAGENLTWKQVALDVLLSCSTALSHISTVGFVYFVPAYMRAALLHRANPQPRTEALLTSTVFQLTHTGSNYSLARLKAFNGDQMQAVIAFLQKIAEVADFDGREARLALERYWLTPRAKEPLICVP